jgi:ABC-type phosphate transport system substrate-binding protein
MVRVTILVLMVALLLAEPGHADERHELVVITHPSRAITIDIEDVRRIFLRQRRFWADGNPIVPINQEGGSLREAFDRLVLPSESGLGAYWDRRYFEGVFPPITLASDEAVRRYVASKPNAIGYVDAHAVDESVHAAFRLPVRPVGPTPTTR